MTYERFPGKNTLKSGRSVADNIASGAMALPAVNPLLTISAAPGNPVQRYVQPNRKPPTKISNNGMMIVEGNGTGNELYAEPNLIRNTSAALATATAGIRLEAAAGTKNITFPSTGQRITLQEVNVRKAEDQREAFDHKGSCIDEAMAIMDTSANAGFGGASGGLYEKVLAHMFQQRGIADADQDGPRIKRKENARIKGIDDLKRNYENFRNLLYDVVYDTPSWLPKNWQAVREAIAGKETLKMSTFWTKLKKLANSNYRGKPAGLTLNNVILFEKLTNNQLAVRDTLAMHNVPPGSQVAGLNEMANPKVGGSFLTLSGGRNVQKKLTWNFHWGAAVMKSGTDIVTIESYAGNEEAKGQWDMYGTEKKEQTFHARHAGTGMHGKSPVTVGAWAGDEGKLNIGSE